MQNQILIEDLTPLFTKLHPHESRPPAATKAKPRDHHHLAWQFTGVCLVSSVLLSVPTFLQIGSRAQNQQ